MKENFKKTKKVDEFLSIDEAIVGGNTEAFQDVIAVKEAPIATIDKKFIPKDDEYGIEVIKDYYGQADEFYLSKKDPEYQYRFLRADDKNLSRKTGNLLFQQGGWQLCGKSHLRRIGIADRFISPDGLYRVGDTVLAFMPKALFNEKDAKKIKEASSRTSAIERMLNEGDPNTGGVEMHATMKGIQTQEKLRMK